MISHKSRFFLRRARPAACGRYCTFVQAYFCEKAWGILGL